MIARTKKTGKITRRFYIGKEYQDTDLYDVLINSRKNDV